LADPAQQGVTTTNPNVDIVQWFAENIYRDLQVGAGDVHPVLQVDAIRYLYTFRNQVREGPSYHALAHALTPTLNSSLRSNWFPSCPCSPVVSSHMM
jgi:hypothetical protein